MKSKEKTEAEMDEIKCLMEKKVFTDGKGIKRHGMP